VVLEVQESCPLILGVSRHVCLWRDEVAHQFRGARRCLIERGFLCNQKKCPKQKGKKKENAKGGKKGSGKKNCF